MASLFKKILGEKEPETQSATSTVPAVDPVHVSDDDFEAVVLQSDKPAVVDLWAEWCGPCHMIAPAVTQLATAYDGRAVIAKLNVDENPVTPGRYGIMGIPTLLFFKNGQEMDRQVGVTNYPALAAKLERLLD